MLLLRFEVGNHCLSAGANAQFLENVRQMVSHSQWAHFQFRSNLFIRKAAGKQSHDLLLAGAQPCCTLDAAQVFSGTVYYNIFSISNKGCQSFLESLVVGQMYHCFGGEFEVI